MSTKISDRRSSPQRVVILGSGGFVGADLGRECREREWNMREIGSREIDLTVTDSAAKLASVLESDDRLVFISALTPDKGRDRKTLLLNLAMADTVCSALEAKKCKQVIYISSDAVYDDAAHPVSESASCNPSSFHGIMHLARERMLSECCKQTMVPLLILRPCAVYGRGDTHNSYGPNRFLRSAQERNVVLMTGEGEELRDHLFIQDLSEVVGESIEREASGILNIATGVSISFHMVASQIRALFPDIEMQSQTRQSPVTHRHFDISELLRFRGGRPMTPFSLGLKKTLGAES